jgi:hypothetical protein
MVEGGTDMVHERHWLSIEFDMPAWPLEREESESIVNLFGCNLPTELSVGPLLFCIHSFRGLEQHSQRPVYIFVRLGSEVPSVSA